jgi:hypothetical protein
LSSHTCDIRLLRKMLCLALKLEGGVIWASKRFGIVMEFQRRLRGCVARIYMILDIIMRSLKIHEHHEFRLTDDNIFVSMGLY